MILKKISAALIALLLSLCLAPAAQAAVIACEVLTPITVTKTGGVLKLVRRVRWAGITTADTCAEFDEGGGFGRITVHVFGTWAGGTLPITGRVSTSATALTLQDPLLNNLAFTADGIAEIYAVPNYIAPGAISGGGPSTSLTVVLELGG